MELEWDEAKRLRTLEERGLDFADVMRRNGNDATRPEKGLWRETLQLDGLSGWGVVQSLLDDARQTVPDHIPEEM